MTGGTQRGEGVGGGGWKGTGREVAASHTLHTLCSKLHDYQDRPP